MSSLKLAGDEAADLLEELAGLEIGIAVDDGDLKLSAPKGALNDALRERIKACKQDLVALLTSLGERPSILRSAGDHPPLSPLQERFWLFESIEAISAANNIPLMLRFEGDLDVEALDRSLKAIVARHETLRTSIGMHAGQPFQQISDSPGEDWLQARDFSELAGELLEARLSERVEAVLRAPFALEGGALIRAEHIRLRRNEHLLLVAMHHLISDGWSMDLFVSELAAFYNHHVGASSALPAPLPVQYADYAVHEREQLQSPPRLRQLDYWRTQLRGAPAALDVPTDRPRPATQSFRGSSYRHVYPAELLRALTALGRSEGATLYMVLLAAIQAFLGRLARQDDVLVGSPITNRPLPELEKLIGFFVNTLAMRGDLSGDPSFRELLRRTRQTSLAAYAHQDVMFDAIVSAVRPVRDRSRSVLQVLLSLHNEPHRQPDLHGLSTRLEVIQTPTAKSDLSFNFVETAAGLSCRVEYAVDLFDESTIAQLLARLDLFFEGLVAEPGRAISRFPVIYAMERAALLHRWSDAVSVTPAERETLASIFAALPPAPGAKLERIFLLDPALQLVPLGWPGEIHLEWSVATPSSSAPDALAGVPSPFAEGRLLCPTREIGVRRPDGRLEVGAAREQRIAPLPSELPVGAGEEACGTPTEELLATIWAEALAITDVRPLDNFFALGGHSIIGIQVISRIFELTGIEVPVRMLFEAQTLREMAAFVDAEARVTV